MQYQFSPRLKMIALVLVVLGAVLYGVGLALHSKSEDKVKELAEKITVENPELVYGKNPSKELMAIAHQPEEHAAHVKHMANQYNNRPWAAFFVPAFFAFGIAGAALFFLCIQFAANAGWGIVVTRVMEGIATFIPIGGILVLIVIIASSMHLNHMYHWMDTKFYEFEGESFDKFLMSKRPWLTEWFWVVRALIVVVGWTVFMLWIKRTTKKQDEHADENNSDNGFPWWKKLHTRSVMFIVFFALTSAYLAWDWIMSLDPHWYSTLFMWYIMVSYLVSAVAIMAMISIYLKRKGALPLFNDNHLHDLAKYMFGFSLLWSYLWLAQFLLQWYANIPEEVQYFQQRFAQNPYYLMMLISNFLLVLLIMISSSIKRRFPVVMGMGFLIILGHYYDIYNAIMPAATGVFHGFGAMELGALLFVAGLFLFVVFWAISRLNLEPKGHPYFHESKIYEYPF